MTRLYGFSSSMGIANDAANGRFILTSEADRPFLTRQFYKVTRNKSIFLA